MIRGRMRIWILVALMIIFVFFTIGKVNTVTYVNGKQGIPPTPSNYKYNSTIYYINGNFKLEAEPRTINIDHNELVQAVIRELKDKPTTSRLQPVVDADVRVLSAEIINKKLYLDLSRDILDSTLWRIGYYDVIVYAIVNSLTQFDTIERVQIMIEGRNLSAYLDNNSLVTAGELSYNDSLIYKEAASSREIVEQFLQYITMERYDLAYNMTNKAGKVEISNSDFERVMAFYRQHKLSYEPTQMFVNEENDGVRVLVNYEYFDTVRNVTYDGGAEEWFLERNEDGILRIRWPRE